MLRGAKLKYFLRNLKIYCTNRFTVSANLIPFQKVLQIVIMQMYSPPIMKCKLCIKKEQHTSMALLLCQRIKSLTMPTQRLQYYYDTE